MILLLRNELALVLGVVLLGKGEARGSLVTGDVVVLFGQGFLVVLALVVGGLGHVKAFEDGGGFVVGGVGCQLAGFSFEVTFVDSSGIEVSSLEDYIVSGKELIHWLGFPWQELPTILCVQEAWSIFERCVLGS